jgi:hypothetical protein
MITLITVFYLSFALIVLMLWAKSRELATGRVSALSRLASGGDRFFHGIHDRVSEAVSYFNRHTFIAFLQWVAAGILSWLRNLYIKLFHLARRHPHSKKVIDMVRGQGEVSAQGGASFFLKKISDGSDAGATTAASE